MHHADPIPAQGYNKGALNPNNAEAHHFTSQNTRTVVQDTLNELLEILDDVTVEYKEQVEPDGNLTLHLTTKGQDNKPFMEIVVGSKPFYIKIMKYAGDQAFQVWKTAVPAIYYTPNKEGDYSIIQAVEKPQPRNLLALVNKVEINSARIPLS